MPDELDRLYALPLGEFTAARDAAAKRLGDPSLRKLRKPSVAAWAVNQLVRTREVDVRRLLRAGEELERAQGAALAGGDEGAFEAARRSERDAIRRLRAAAAEVLREGGHAASAATLERVTRTLHAAAADAEGRALLHEGRLTEELEPRGFDALGGLAAAAPRPRRRARAAPTKADRRRAEAARKRAHQARTEADAAQADLERAEGDLREAERTVARARTAAERARARAERLEAAARELES